MSEMSNAAKTIEMARRVGLPKKFALRIFYMQLRTMHMNPGGIIDMVQIACAIKYAGDNKHLIKAEYR